jgi:hypothetical protein
VADGASPDNGDASEAEKRPQQFAPLSLTVQRFQATMDALRELLEAALPHAQTIDSTRLAPSTLAAISRLTPEKRAKLEEYQTWTRARVTEARAAREAARDGSETGDVEANQEDPASTLGSDPALPNAGAIDPEVKARLDEIFGDDPAAVIEYAMNLTRSAIAPNRVALLSESILTMAVATFEALLAGLASEHYILFPGTLDSTDREFSLADLARFSTIDDARHAAIEERVLRLMRGSLDDWAAWFESRYKLVAFREFVDFDELTEIFQRRHILMHSGGRVSRLYLDNVPSPPADARLGGRLRTDHDYVVNALDAINVIGILTGVVLWCRWTKGEADYARERLFEVMYSLMLAGRWKAVRDMTRAVLDHLAMLGSQREVTQVNFWLAQKRLGEFDNVKDDVTNWDTSALAGRFSIAKAALLDELDELFSTIIPAYHKGDISQGAVVEWPLLEEFRADERYATLLEQIAPPEGAQPQSGSA